MNKSKKNFVELNKNLAKLHLTKRMPTAPNRKLVANNKKSLLDTKKQAQKNQSINQLNKPKLNKATKMANVSFEDDLDMAMTSAGYALYIAIKRQQFR